jgi:predicted ATPase/DNA-binding SARP family transcriptional activator
METIWHIELFGDLHVRQGHQNVLRFEPCKLGGLLALLALHAGRCHARETLIDALWPEADMDVGRARLRVTLAALRRLLEPCGVPAGSVLVADRSSVHLHPGAVTTDVGQFEAALSEGLRDGPLPARVALLRQALDCYRQELLAGWYDAWIDLERQRLVAAHMEALRQMTAALEACGDLAGALDYARRVVAADPLREEAHCALMRLYAAVGQPAAALRQYRELEVLLRNELQEAPTGVARALVSEIRCRSAQFAPEVTEPLSLPVPSAGLVAFPPLPLLLTPFFDREAECRCLRAWLQPPDRPATEASPTAPAASGAGEDSGESGSPAPLRHRLVTLTGPGGTGKTRLALEVAQDLRAAFAEAVCFVPFSDVTQADQIPRVVAEALGRREARGTEPLEALEEVLQRPALLVLDNFEQIAAAGGAAILALLQRFPTLRLLVTSRHRLNIIGERELSLSPLPVPLEARTPEQLLSYACVQLFVSRIRAIRPEFAVTETNMEAIAQLCCWLEGLPLALEMAAEWAAVLTPAQMRLRLRRRLDLVRRNPLTDARHRTLRAVVDGSYALLSPDLQRFLARLSTLSGVWTLEKAEEVCAEPQALQYLAELWERSLVMVEETADEIRFRVLEMVRERAVEGCLPLVDPGRN